MQGHANTIEPYSYLYYYIELVKLIKTYRRNYREDGMNICRQVFLKPLLIENKKSGGSTSAFSISILLELLTLTTRIYDVQCPCFTQCHLHVGDDTHLSILVNLH